MNTAASSNYVANDGGAYERFIGRWTRRLADAVIDASEPFVPGKLLDVGCGTGSMAIALRQRFADREIAGVDVAEPYLAFARDRPEAAGCTFLQQDATALDFPDASFAASFATIVLNFVGDADQAAREMRRVTAPGGQVVIASWDFRGGLVYQRMLWDTAAVLDPDAAARRAKLFAAPLAKPDGMVDLLTRNGLKDVVRKSVTIRMDFADFDDYWGPLTGGQGPVGAYVVALAPEMQERVKAAVQQAFLAGDTDGQRSLTATAWVVSGRV